MNQFRSVCDNLNHRRAHAPVRHCPTCGGAVNEAISAGRCSEAHHATARRQQNTFCVDCGARLIPADGDRYSK